MTELLATPQRYCLHLLKQEMRGCRARASSKILTPNALRHFALEHSGGRDCSNKMYYGLRTVCMAWVSSEPYAGP